MIEPAPVSRSGQPERGAIRCAGAPESIHRTATRGRKRTNGTDPRSFTNVDNVPVSPFTLHLYTCSIQVGVTNMEKAIGYARVSTMDQAVNGESLDVQRDAIRAYCEATVLELVDVVVDAGVSGYTSLADRPGGKKVLDLLRRKEARHVVTLKLDRMFRRASDALDQTATWDKAEVGLHVLNMGGQSVNTSTAVGRVFLSMLAVFAEFERNLISERTKEAMAVKRERGERISRFVPYGFQLADDGKTLEPNPDERRVVHRIVNLRLTGTSYRGIAVNLNAKGVTTRKGTPWRHQYVVNVLQANT